jgi:hypothetical protein
VAEIVPVSELTGEVVRPSGDLTLTTLTTYARARAARDFLALQREDYLAELATRDARLGEITARLEEARTTAEEIETMLAAAFDDETRVRVGAPITLDVGAVRVTWGKPALRWVQSVRPEEIARTDATLAQRLGIAQVHSKPPMPRITVRALG